LLNRQIDVGVGRPQAADPRLACEWVVAGQGDDDRVSQAFAEIVPRRPPPRRRSAGAATGVGSGQNDSNHLDRAMDNGLTQAQSLEILTGLAFYAGWPNVFSALPEVKGVFETRRRERCRGTQGILT
jgi:4-carboxymuconolactone decarboxylase